MNSNIQDHALEQYSDEQSLKIEDKVWWLQGRKSIIRRFLRLAKQRIVLDTIMDIGCGSGGNLDILSEFASVIGIERSGVLAQRARSRGIASSIIENDAFNLPTLQFVQLFTLFDVLEHIESDVNFLRHLNTVAPKKHLLLVSVPAAPFLYGDHDRILHHYRRYSKNKLYSTLEEAGYRVIKINYFMFFLFPLAIFERLKDNILSFCGIKRTQVNIGIMPDWANNILKNILQWESYLFGIISFPIGLWLFVLAERDE